VQADINKPTEAAYIGEAKIWRGQAATCGDLEQVIGYATARTENLMLLYYVRQNNLALIRQRAREAIRLSAGVSACKEDCDGDLIATVQHPRFETNIAVSVLFVHLPTAATDPDA